ncbi:MAG: phage tail sheath C-terminal domain-containing protein [Paenibacillus sp.]|uniref:phage tail sheath C-terminal domain-containing protein n=1 Tax=Paenibacillus sp. TaxID=58172 RepID=UPI00291427B2|nr:phage tail sheath C-terminal domain-containing protein [Paenibacillus sp.]MDU4696393.1 phage tail sheath C-terminal domain-containing protein [Paenibacillus sp.]
MIGLPQIDITFARLAESLIQRSSSGIVALIIKDSTDSNYEIKEYKAIPKIEAGKYTPTNLQYIKDVLSGGAAKVIVVPVDPVSDAVVGSALQALGSRKYNWIGLAEGAADEQLDLTAFIKEQEAAKKSVKGLVYNVAAPDCQHVVNFVNESVTYLDGRTVTGDKFVPRLLGVLAGLPLTRSSTYYSFNDLVSVKEPADVEAAINSGKFVLFNDEDTVRVARGVNSLTTLSPTTSDDFKKILIVETMDLIREDITNTFKNDYVGKFRNTTDNQILLITSVNRYFATLGGEDVLDPLYANKADINVDLQRAAWVESGRTEAEEWDDQTVRNQPFRSNVYLRGNIKIPDAMEDLAFGVELQ